jgi:ABC-2 type transport system ATP-binding protein
LHDLAEIETFATHVAYLDQGRLQFVEEMTALSSRFREVEVVLESEGELPAELPADWLNAERTGLVARFVHARYDGGRTETEIRRMLPGVREIAARGLPLRAIFVALAKSAKRARRGGEL